MESTRTCSIEGRDRGGRLIRGWCGKHYNRWWFHGAPTFTKRPGLRLPTSERFWMNVKQDGECWVWAANINPNGYGHFDVDGRTVRAHRFAYEDLRAEIPEGLHIDHLCRNRACVNPWHLEPVTQAVNTARGTNREALNRWLREVKTHCVKGHPLSGDNLRIDGRGWRKCRQCRADSSRKAYAALKRASK